MEYFNNHKNLYITATTLFVALTILVCIIPALDNEKNYAPLPNSKPLSKEAEMGKAIFVSEGCMACHTQQVRNVDMDKTWGKRPSIAADYAGISRTDIWRNTATLMGTERTGPDLTNIGSRQPSSEWNLTHLYNPRILVKESIMPSYPWLFEEKENVLPTDVVVTVPEEYLTNKHNKIVATPKALHLIAYLQSLVQADLPETVAKPIFLYKKEIRTVTASNGKKEELDGAPLYANNCQMCHQENGKGLKGAFPALKDSKVVLNEDPKTMVDIIMNGYSGRISEGYAVMPPVGTNNNLSPEEITAIMNYVKTNWGNNAPKVTTQQIDELVKKVKK
ncbi:cytochrome C oxidase mono-heme subunit/FixO [Pseudopedobacter saltans DSM 12145]|uniref:Cytochrome C oxidase mono-heme subunit/FixO n=1 Tax=Pseudopedobacter saltans (strain ATCC 51119 / DSM 12145 / JCM 21818 / CCUG 39354 / LMG 10337 / NBRC 100064 / NCIMB 13643) TaxID=762903 RepID=F0SCX0_PSESL|nr:cbb3-type cytochrome c oxidase subunit II [Pseudopedobacter saltans]ADY50709.1 cytochrome C oxidase mono-heme subunit/FixO [Pseudopedobacter saltans DSM 12145]